MCELTTVMQVFQQYRMQPTGLDQYESVGKAILENRIASFIGAGKPIDFVMLGFPFKSTNTRDKVLGIRPDMGEKVTIDNFTKFNNQIKKAYAPGVNISIVSDGYIFNDLLDVPDNVVREYKDVSEDMAKESPLKWFDLNDFYSTSLVENRAKVVEHFGITPEKLEQDILMNPDVNTLYRGMILFMEEELAMKSFVSKSQQQKAAKKLAREMMFRNEAYSNLVRKEFASHIRLSMHPSVNNGAKYSFKLIPGNNTRHSAWHSVLVVKDETYTTMHKKEAQAAGYELVTKDGQPFFFQGN